MSSRHLPSSSYTGFAMAHNPGLHNTLIRETKLVTSPHQEAGIPQTYDDLFIVIKNLKSYLASGSLSLKLYCNNDTTAGNYFHTAFYQQTTTENSVGGPGSVISSIPGTNGVTGAYITIWMPDYAGATSNQQMKSASADPNNTSMANHAGIYQRHNYSLWKTSAAVHTLTFTCDWGFRPEHRLFIYGVSYNRP